MPYNGAVPYEGKRSGELPEPPKEGRWISRPKRSRWMAPAFGGTFIASQLPNWANIVFGSDHHSPVVRIVVFALLAVFGIVAACCALQRRLARRVRPRDAALLDGAFGDQFLVDVTILTGKRPLAIDRGALWFADGLIGFSGEVFSFVLATQDVKVAWTAKPATRDRIAVPVGSLALVGAPVLAYIGLSPLDHSAKSLRERLRAFEGETASPSAERYWPPLKPYDEASALPPGAVGA